MDKIILASGSRQRKRLLQETGLSFVVMPARVKENTRIKTTCAEFVKENALLKAENVAKRVNDGLVIGADTTVYGGKKRIIGKPKDVKDAKRILKRMFKEPHWVYTGVAIIDTKTKKVMTDYEKTKIFMNRLTDEEIDRYHRKVPPMDKAGGFDIEGNGGLFINRIEGCYSNVIGLPMAKLRLMLLKMGVSLV